MKNYTTLFVNPVIRSSAQNRHKQQFTLSLTTGQLIQKPMNKTKEFGVGSEYTFKLDMSRGRLVTGLDVMIENPFKGLDISELRSSYSLSSHWSNERLEQIVKSNEIKKQTKFEILDDVKEGTYTSEVKHTIFNSKGLKDNPTTFLQDFKIILYDKPNRFTSETPRGRMAIQLIKQRNDIIAENTTVVNTSVHQFYISEENEQEERLAKKREKIESANYHLYKLKREYKDIHRYMIASLCTDNNGKVIIKGDVNDISVRNALSLYIDNSRYQMENIKKFEKLVDMLEGDEDAQSKLYIKYLIQQAINSNIISPADGSYIWHSKKEHPNVYTFTTKEKLENVLLTEYFKYDKDLDVTNWFGELKTELENRTNVKTDIV